MVERYETLGGVCLNVGCIPSKALLHVAKVIAEAETLGRARRRRSARREIDARRAARVEGRRRRQAHRRARRHGQAAQGPASCTARRASPAPHTLEVAATTARPRSRSTTRSSPPARARSKLPGIPHDDPRVMDSTGALELADIPERLLVIGGGIIGLEMATVYDALGSQRDRRRAADQLIPGCDTRPRPAAAASASRSATRRSTSRRRSRASRRSDDGLHVDVLRRRRRTRVFDRVLVAVGRAPNGAGLGLDAAGVEVDERGFVARRRPAAHERRRTSSRSATSRGRRCSPTRRRAEGHVAAEVIAGHDVAYDVRAMPSVAYTEPEVAWVGLTETEAKAQRRRSTRRRRSRGRRPAARWRWTARRARRSCSSTPRRSACSAPASSARTPASCVAEVGARDRDGRRRRGRRAHRPRAPDAVGDRQARRRDRGRHDHRPAEPEGSAQEQVGVAVGDLARRSSRPRGRNHCAVWLTMPSSARSARRGSPVGVSTAREHAPRRAARTPCGRRARRFHCAPCSMTWRSCWKTSMWSRWATTCSTHSADELAQLRPPARSPASSELARLGEQRVHRAGRRCG